MVRMAVLYEREVDPEHLLRSRTLERLGLGPRG